MDDLDFDELSEEETHEAREAYWNVRVPGHHSVPSVTTVNIDVRSYENDTHSKALLSIENVTSIQLELSGLANSNSNCDSLVLVLESREKLEKLVLSDAYGAVPSDRITPFSLAIQQNPRITTVTFERLRLSGDSMATFLDTATSITSLKMEYCIMEMPGGFAHGCCCSAAQQKHSTAETESR
jgi:hypothetical protein